MMLPTKGDTSNVQNGRPLAILDVTYKVLERVLNNRLMPYLEPEQGDEQTGLAGLVEQVLRWLW